MKRRMACLGLLVVLSQVAAGCCWHRCGCWRPFRCHSCGPAYGPAYAPVAPPIGGCPSCYTPPVTAMAIAPPPLGPVYGTATFTNPSPILTGPTVVPEHGGGPIPLPMPAKSN